MALLGLQVLEIFLYFLLLVVKDNRTTSGQDVEVKFGGSYIQDFIVAQKVAGSFALLFGVFGLLFTLGTFLGDNMTRLFHLVLIKGGVICCFNTFLMAFFVSSRIALTAVVSFVQLLSIFVCFKLNWKISSASVDQDSLRDVPTIMRALLNMRPAEKEQGAFPLSLHLLEKLLTWLSGWDAARTFSGDGRKHLTRISIVALFLVVSTYSFDYSIIIGKDYPLFSEVDYEWVTNNSGGRVPGWEYENSTGNPKRLEPKSGYGTNRVVLLMFDGWGFDAFNSSESMQALRKDPDLSDDMTLLKLRAEVPSTDIPTWQQIISGVKPESTGYRGDYRIGDPKLDTLFHQINRTNTLAGVSSVPWFTHLFKKYLPALQGDGGVSSYFREKPGLSFATKEEDQKRANAILRAMKSPKNYALLVGHFFGVNYNGHYYGTIDKQFTEAMDNATKIVESIIRNVTDTSVIVIVVGNHGHLIGGGFGGVTDSVLNVPLLVYKKNSKINSQIVPIVYKRDEVEPFSLIDLCPSLAAMIGVPVPRHNQGYFIDDLMTSQLVHPDVVGALRNDLFYQQQVFVKRWIQRMGYSPVHFVFDDQFLSYKTPGPVEGIRDLLDLHFESRWQNERNMTGRNIGASILIICTALLVYVYVFQTLTIADPFAVFWVTVHPRLKDWLQTPDFRSAKLAIICTASYFALVWGVFAFGTSVVEQSQFDSSFLHRRFYQGIYLGMTFCPGIMSIWVISRAVSYQLSRDERLEQKVPLLKSIGNFLHRFFLEELVVLDVAYYHVFHMYLLLIAIIATMWIFFGSTLIYNFFVPSTFRLTYLTESNWRLQFRLMTSLGICAPLLCYAGFQVYTWGDQPIDSYVLYEINRFRAEKARRYRDLLAVDLGEPTKVSWEMPNVEGGDVESTKLFGRLSDWCFEVLKSHMLTSAEKRKLVNEQYAKFMTVARRTDQEKTLVARQLESVVSDYNARHMKVRDMEKKIQDNRDLISRGVQALREIVQKQMEADVKAKAAQGRKVHWRGNPEKEENRRMGAFLITKMREHERQRQKVMIEDRKAWLQNQSRSQFEQDLAEIRRQQRDVVDQTMELSKKQDALDEEIANLNSQLDEIVARIKEFESVKKRVAESINKDIQVHKQIQKEILEELRKEADYHMYVHNLIDSVSDDIQEKQRKITNANNEGRETESKLEKKIESLNDKIELSKKQKMELFREVKNTVDQLTKTKLELTSNIRWAHEYKQKLAEIAKIM